ncbi:MAG: hypothetical protein ACKVP0_26575 [Pirellulaceae bacterium]
MKLPTPITWLQYAFANAAIVFLVPFLALQGMPPVDWLWNWAIRSAPGEEELGPTDDPTPVAGWLAGKMVPVANLTGVSTATWSMFAPNPDATNHRLRAKIEYRDGSTVEWRSPDWPEISCWHHFWASRELEYIDKIAYNSPQERWHVFADFLAAKHRQNPQPEGAPRRVTFVMEEASIENPTDPEGGGWVPMSQFIPRTREDVITPKRVYPVPPELLKKESAGPAAPMP